MRVAIRLVQDETGASSVEYAMIAVVVAVVLAAIMPIIGVDLTTMYTGVSSKM